MTGLQHHRSKGNIRFMTLTSKPGTTEAEFQRYWRSMKEKLRRRGIMEAYIKTMERGGGTGMLHAHLLVRGRYVDLIYLSHLWEQCSMAYRVHIALPGGKRPDGSRYPRHMSGLANELAKYMSKFPQARLSYSWSWAWKGLAQSWEEYKRWFWRSRKGTKWDMPGLLYLWSQCARWALKPRDNPYVWQALGPPPYIRTPVLGVLSHPDTHLGVQNCRTNTAHSTGQRSQPTTLTSQQMSFQGF